ncbi:MAG: hypothetical protein ACLVKO_09705 [Dysgonomonas sp.]
MSFIDYIKGNRKGKDARRIELEAMYDPFLDEAIEGYNSVKGNHNARIAKMQRKVSARTTHRNRKIWLYGLSSAAAILLIIYFINIPSTKQSVEETTLYVYVPEKYVEKIQMEDKSVSPVVEIKNAEILSSSVNSIEVYIPREYIEKKRNTPDERAKTPAVIINIEEVFEPEEPINIYIPEKYSDRVDRNT